MTILEAKTITQLWEDELDDFIESYDKWETKNENTYN